MNRPKNAPTEQAQKLSKDCKTGNAEKHFEDILAVTSEYYGEALENLANGETPGENEE